MANNTNIINTQFQNVVDNFGKTYIFILFISGAIWAFIAIDNFNSPDIFKLALVYALLLIFGFFGISFDRRGSNLGLDSRIWDGRVLMKQLGLGIIFFVGWYLLFMRTGFSVATAQAATFTVSPTVNFFLTSVLGPLAENIFFFGVINITFITILRDALKNRNNALMVAGLIALSIPLFSQVPNSFIILISAAGLLAMTALTKNKLLMKHAPLVVAALVVGAAVFPRFHGYAYQLNESNYIAASWFGFFACLITSYIGLFPADIAHIANNAVVAIGG